MSQINLSANVINGNQVIQFPVNTDLSSVIQGDIFSVITDIPNYNILSVDDNLDRITLTGNYGGTTNPIANSLIHNSNTSPDLIPYPEAGDIKNISVIKQGFLKVQELFTSVKNNILTIESDQNTDQTNITNLQTDTKFIKDRFLVAEIDQIISVIPVVASVIYDTTQDSDGGNWRFLKKSWYSETTPSGNYLGQFLNEAAARAAGGIENDWYQNSVLSVFYKLNVNTETQIYRAGRKEFPKISLIIAESDKVIIYDLTDSEPSMWMVFVGAASNALYISSGTVSTIAMLEGVLVSASTSSGTSRINFANDLNNLFHVSDMFKNIGDISERNDALSLVVADTNTNMISNLVNDVAMAVLPNAPIDSVTGLKVPTIAVATDGGISVITDSGEVYDITDTVYPDYNHVAFSKSGGLKSTNRTITGDFPYLEIYNSLPEADISNSSDFQIDTSSTPTYSRSSGYIKIYIDNVIGSDLGITLLKENFDSFADSMVAYITKDYSTGWMVGDIRGCLLADSNVGSIVGTELVTNGTFDTVTTGWTGAFATLSIDTARLKILNSGSSDAGTATQSFSTVVGETYTVSTDFTYFNKTGYWRIGTSSGGSQYTQLNSSSDVVFIHTFVATSTTTHITLVTGGGSAASYTFWDNVSCRLAVDDRSVKANGAQVFGTVTKSLIDTNSELVAYSGFSASNYLEQPYTSDLDFANGDWWYGMWLNEDSNSTTERLFSRMEYTGSWSGAGYSLFINGGGTLQVDVTDDAYATRDSIFSSNTIDDGQWHFVECYRYNDVMYIRVDTTLWASGALVSAAPASSLSNPDATLTIGLLQDASGPLTNGSLALFRASSTLPTAEQRKHIYETERQMIVNKCLLDGTSNAITALDFNEKRNVLSAATSSHRSDFDNLVRIDSEATAVGSLTAISNDGDMKFNGGATGSDIFVPEIDLRAELIGHELVVEEDHEWKDLELLNNWVNFSATYNSPQYRKIGDIVELRGVIKDGTSITNTDLFILPVGLRPKSRNIYTVQDSLSATGRLDVLANGICEIISGGNSQFVLDGISFSVS